MADQISVKLPDGTVSLGTWTVVGAGGDADLALRDGSDATYVQNSNRCMVLSQKLKLTIADWSTSDIPAGSKIKSLRAVAKCGTISGITTQPLCILWFAQAVIYILLTGNVTRVLHAIFNWRCPRPPPASPSTQWVFQELKYATTDANNEEWTLNSINTFEVHLGRDNAGTNLKIGEVSVEAAFNERPVGTATGPTTTQTATTRPPLTHTYSDPENDPQEQYRWLVYNDAQYGAGGFDPTLNDKDQPVSKPYYDSGWIPGEELTWTPTADLVNDTYRAYVIVQQQWDGLGVHRSTPTFVGWTQNVPGPPAPVVTATPQDELWRIQLDVTKGGSSPATETYNILYSDNSGVDWELVRGGEQVVAVGGDTAQLWDYEAPLNVARWYKVQAFRTLGSIKVGGDFSEIVMATPRTKEFLLKDPLVPTLNMALPLGNKGDLPSQSRSMAFHKPLTKTGEPALAVATLGRRYGIESQLTLKFLEDQQLQWDKFNAIYEGGRTLLYQLPTGKNYYIMFGPTVAVSDWDIDFKLDLEDQPAEVMYFIASVDYQQVRKP